MARTPIVVNRESFEKIIKDVESSGPLSTLAELYRLVSERYNSENKDYDPINPTIVGLRISDWELEVKTVVGKRGKAAVEVDRERLTTIFTKHNGQFNFTELCKVIAEEYVGISPSVVASRIKEWSFGYVSPRKERVSEEPVPEKPKAVLAPDEIDKWVAVSATAFGHTRNLIVAPAGRCPVKLGENVEEWVELVVEDGLNLGKLYTVPALTYFVRQFHPYQSGEYVVCRERIRGYVLEKAGQMG